MREQEKALFELRETLVEITGAVDVLLKNPQLDQFQRLENLQQILTSVQEMTRGVRELVMLEMLLSTVKK